jgi:hypothetical protein
MIKEMQGWKVLSYSRFSANAPIICRDARKVMYPVNEIVSPKMEGSKLFFFKRKIDAILFKEIHSAFQFMIVPCIAYNCSKAKIMVNGDGMEGTMQLFWELKNRKKRTVGVSTPTGTWFAEKIKCLE